MSRRFAFSDTSPEAEAVHVRLLREAGPSRRSALALDMSKLVVGLSLRGLREANPTLSDEEIALRFVGLTYGRDLAQKLTAYLKQRTA